MQVLFEFQGTSSLVMNNGRGIDSRLPISRLISELRHKSPRTDADDAEADRLEWMRALYHDDEIGLYVPAANLWRCMRNAGLLVDKKGGGKLIERGLAFTTDRFPLTYSGPRDLQALYELPEFRLRGPVVIDRKRVMKTWPVIPHWSLSFEAEMAEDILNFDVLVRIAAAAGRFEGLCDDRKHGHGRFQAMVAGGQTRAEQLAGRANGREASVATA